VSDVEQGQVTGSAAEVYERLFVPALFARWAIPVVEAAAIESGHQVLDAACGTGILARTAHERVGATGSVVGLDVNPGMLAVARSVRPEIEWREGRFESLPFPDACFDRVVSQFGLMFLDDLPAAFGEVSRVLRPGGRTALAVWDALERTPGYLAMADLLYRLFGEEAADSLRVPYRLGEEPDALVDLARDAGLVDAAIECHPGRVEFPSLDDWVYTDIRGWTLADRIDDRQYAMLLDAARRELAEFVQANGRVVFDSPALILTARRG